MSDLSQIGPVHCGRRHTNSLRTLDQQPCIGTISVVEPCHAWQQVLDGGERVSAEIRLNRLYAPPVGDPVPATVLLLAFPYRKEEKVLSVMACLTDVSRLKWAENWQARLARDAQEAKRQQEAFIDIVSHEMRNPLSAIMHCVEDITTAVEACNAQGTIPQFCEDALAESVSAARTIEICATHQRYIIDSILTLGRMESALLSIVPSPVVIGELCESIVTMFKSEIRANNISTTVGPHSSYGQLHVEKVFADTSRVTQIFINLLTNAIKFVKGEPNRHIQIKYGANKSSSRLMFPTDIHWAPKGDQAGDVTKSEEWGDGEQIYLTFSVKDSGIGVDPQQRLRIFERFKQANVKTHINYGGSGLGLFVSKQLVERQGGEIGVRSTIGQGSMFAFYIRVRRVSELSMTAPAPHLPLHPRPKPMTTVSPVRSLEIESVQSKKFEKVIHVLLVEDNIVNQRVWRKQLERNGCIVHTANHGAEALQQLRGMNCYKDRVEDGTPLDIILMDIQMPVMGGMECTKEIRRLQADGTICCHVPIIAVTANVRQEQRDETMAAGLDAILLKPFKMTNLMVSINEQLTNHTQKSN